MAGQMKIIITFILYILSSLTFANDANNTLHWVTAGYGRIPKHALIGGHDASGSPFYICQATFQGDIYTGRIVGENCNFKFENAEAMTPHYQVLVTRHHYDWIAVNGSFIPMNPVYSICQANYQGGIHPGVVKNNRCHINYAGNQVKAAKYNVLIAM